MNLFETIIGKVFGNNANASNPVPPQSPATPAAAATSAGFTPATSTPSAINVQDVISKMAAQKGEKLNWQTSIVDLMKVLDMDSSFESRKQLAQELKYSGDTKDSAAMNTWLHKEVMQRFAKNGGHVPPELLH